MSRWIVSIVDRVFAVVGALFFSQIPLFMLQYTQRLGGHVAELHLQVNKLQAAAHRSGKTLDQWIQKFVLSGDPDFSLQGELMKGMYTRWQELVGSLQALNDAAMVSRPFVFFADMKWDIAKGTLQAFQPGLPLTLEGGIYALIGLVAGFGLFSLLRRGVSSIIPKKKRTPEEVRFI